MVDRFRTEVPAGSLYEMPPMGEAHIGALRYLAEVFFTALGRKRTLSQMPIILPSDGVCELWIIDLVEQCALVYRGGQLVARYARGRGATLQAELVPEISVDLDEVFQAARLP